MFSRNFMKTFPIRKYADLSARTGSVNTDMWIANHNEIRIKRVMVYCGVAAIMLLMFDNFHSVDEMIGTTTRPTAHPVYERYVPKEVLYPNLEIIAGFQAINKMKDLQETFAYEK